MDAIEAERGGAPSQAPPARNLSTWVLVRPYSKKCSQVSGMMLDLPAINFVQQPKLSFLKKGSVALSKLRTNFRARSPALYLAIVVKVITYYY